MEVKIEKNVPIPQGAVGAKRGGLSDVIRKMEVGDSFVAQKKADSMQHIAYMVLGPGHVTIRKIDDNSCRVWRIK